MSETLGYFGRSDFVLSETVLVIVIGKQLWLTN